MDPYYDDGEQMYLDEQKMYLYEQQMYLDEQQMFEQHMYLDEQNLEQEQPPFEPPVIKIDVSHLFKTDQFFPTRADLLVWARDVANRNGYVVVITKSNNVGRFNEIVHLGCERGGIYKPYKNPDAFTMKRTRSRKINCPFHLKGRPMNQGADWWLKVMCGEHNHESASSLLGHNYPGRLNVEEKGQVESMCKDWVAPRKILLNVKENNPSNLTTIDQIYGVCKRFRKNTRGPLTEMQHLLRKMDDDNYVHYERCGPDSDEIRDVFWAHPNAVKLFNTFPQVVIMDCTYKTNRYRIPLLEIVGITSTDMTYSIGFCYMAKEGTNDYTWALECMKSLISDPSRLPSVVVTDRDLALLRVVREVLPTATHLLCAWHITKCVDVKCKAVVGTDHIYEAVMGTDHIYEAVMDQWKVMINAETIADFQGHWNDMVRMCGEKFVPFLNYVATTWLVHQEKFVKAWTNRVMHFGTTTSNRVESAHASFKKMLRDSKGDMVHSWDAAHRLTMNRHTEILANFERSKARIDHIFMSSFYECVRGFVSRKALELIHAEAKRYKIHGECNCVLKVTHGLPCGCELAGYKRIPYDAVHQFWKTLSWDHVPVAVAATTTSTYTCTTNHGDLLPEIEGLSLHFNSLDAAGQNMVRRKIKAIFAPESSSLCTPEVPIRSQRTPKDKRQPIGSLKREPSRFEHVDNEIEAAKKPSKPRRSKSKKSAVSFDRACYIEHFPSFFHRYIADVIDVVGDGNCGYRCIAALMGHPHGQEGWPWVRGELIAELETNLQLYEYMFQGRQIIQALHERLTHPPGQACLPAKYMSLPEMGYLIAIRFQRVFVTISLEQCWTYLPLTGPGPPDEHRIIAVGCVPGHLVQLRLVEGHPMPCIAPQWEQNVDAPSMSWSFPYAERLYKFEMDWCSWHAEKYGGPRFDYVDITGD